MQRLLVIGGDAGGMAAAAQARRRRPADELAVVAFERGEYTSYAGCGLPFLVGGLVEEVDSLISRTPEEHRERGIDVRLRHEVVAIDTAARSITVRDLEADSESVETYDDLVIATGAEPVRPALPGADAEGIHGVQTITDGIALRAAVDALAEDARAVVVGGGYIGLEMAEAMRHRGLHVTLVERASEPMTTLDPDMGHLVADAMRGIGIEVRGREPVTGFETDGGRVAAVVTEAGEYPADIVVLGLGVRPRSALARDAGLDVGDHDGIRVDSRMRTSAEGVWAAGDCVEVYDRVASRHLPIALGTHANKQGRVIGINVTGGDIEFPGVVGTAITKICGYEVGRVGLGADEAADLGIDAVSATIESSTRSSYYPGSRPITVKLVAERSTGRLLGGQIVGGEGSAKRVDVLAVALWNEMGVEELTQVDLGYSPPFGPLWDPVLIAARRVLAAL